MCPLCATTAALTAAMATVASTAIATWGLDLGELIMARCKSLIDWLLRSFGMGSSSKGA
jgi:hypothetical protein